MYDIAGIDHLGGKWGFILKFQIILVQGPEREQ